MFSFHIYIQCISYRISFRGFINSEFHGTNLYWSQYGPDMNKKLVQDAKFENVLDEIIKSGGSQVDHHVLLCKKVDTKT